MDPDAGLLASPSWVCSQPAEPSMEGRRSPSPREQGRDSSFPQIQVPSGSLTDPDWFWDEHTQAKRARVETIIRGMCLSPNPLVPSNAPARDSPGCPEKARERKRKQSLPMQQTPLTAGLAGNHGGRKGGPQVRQQLHLLKQQLRQLQEHILQAAAPGDTAQGPGGAEKGRDPPSVQQRNGCGPWARGSDHHQGSRGDRSGEEKRRAAEGKDQPEEPRFLSSETRAWLETLRKELTGAVSQAVDSVLQKVLLLDPPGHLTQLKRSFQGLVPEGRSKTSLQGGACNDPLPLATFRRRAQAQAGAPLGNVSLAQPLDPAGYPVSPRMISKPCQASPANCPLTVPSHMQENQILSQLLGQGSNGHWSSSLTQDPSSQSHPSSSESALCPWGAVRLRPSVLSQQQPPAPFVSTCLEKRPFLPSVKMEQGSLLATTDVLPFPSVHESLNPGHLKKAKLMFFFTRYPSSNLLKAYFPDIQFNRCITSQMIKWFSNFREFYYIQMEKFARQAVSDGLTNPKMLVVLRDSDLFRALNLHYNKGNDFEVWLVTNHTHLVLTFSCDYNHNEQLIESSMKGKNFGHTPVPDCFLEVASLTLQEFFRAVSTGKDSDPSWKKPIYKVISKLDSDIPEIFKSSSYPQEQFRN